MHAAFIFTNLYRTSTQYLSSLENKKRGQIFPKRIKCLSLFFAEENISSRIKPLKHKKIFSTQFLTSFFANIDLNCSHVSTPNE
ncbi:MAG: hypothetical protein CMP10_21930 [Zetaproteobacteria bacterium]|nr:hypothetical protein [Pseudobdellovibrionaceae bacterium]